MRQRGDRYRRRGKRLGVVIADCVAVRQVATGRGAGGEGFCVIQRPGIRQRECCGRCCCKRLGVVQ